MVDIKSPVAEARNEYLYSAGGQKLRVTQKWNSNFSTAPVIGSTINTAALNMTKTADYVGNKVYENNQLKRILVDGGYIEAGVYYYYLASHLGNNHVVAKQDGTSVQSISYYPFGMHFAPGVNTATQPYLYNNKELDQMHGLNLYDYHARQYESAIGRFTTPDPLAEKYYSISPYVYCNNNPMRYIDPTGMFYDDYYSSLNGKYLGSDNMPSTHMRLIDDEKFSQIKNDVSKNIVQRGQTLQAEGTKITIDNAKIQSDLQAVADKSSAPNASGSYQEHQIYLTLDRATATISSYVGTPGTHNQIEMSYYPAPATGVNFVDKPGGLVLIGQAHGHPPTNTPGYVTAKTMSPNFDVPASASANVPIYGLDAMDGSTKGNPTAIHRVTPNGTITNNVGRTSSGFDIGRDAMQIWGRRR
jgi:RHS repeat-associated protein